jgi:hypothetical protein
MDTRFWGPSGWRLLHLITFAYDPRRDRKSIHAFFDILPFVLPCKFCRAHLIEHYESLPLEPALESRETLSKWLWKIHGAVNTMLRKQGQSIAPDPTFLQTRNTYEERLQYGCTQTDFPGWEFLFSIVENHPLAPGEISTPLPGAPPLAKLIKPDLYTLCRWNYLSPDIRFEKICQFWSLLPQVLPFPEWRDSWIRHGDAFCKKPSTSKKVNLKELWRIRCAIETELELLNRSKFRQLCNDLKLHRSDCQKSRRARTCRKSRKRTRSRSR